MVMVRRLVIDMTQPVAAGVHNQDVMFTDRHELGTHEWMSVGNQGLQFKVNDQGVLTGASRIMQDEQASVSHKRIRAAYHEIGFNRQDLKGVSEQQLADALGVMRGRLNRGASFGEIQGHLSDINPRLGQAISSNHYTRVTELEWHALPDLTLTYGAKLLGVDTRTVEYDNSEFSDYFLIRIFKMVLQDLMRLASKIGGFSYVKLNIISLIQSSTYSSVEDVKGLRRHEAKSKLFDITKVCERLYSDKFYARHAKNISLQKVQTLADRVEKFLRGDDNVSLIEEFIVRNSLTDIEMIALVCEVMKRVMSDSSALIEGQSKTEYERTIEFVEDNNNTKTMRKLYMFLKHIQTRMLLLL